MLWTLRVPKNKNTWSTPISINIRLFLDFYGFRVLWSSWLHHATTISTFVDFLVLEMTVNKSKFVHVVLEHIFHVLLQYFETSQENRVAESCRAFLVFPTIQNRTCFSAIWMGLRSGMPSTRCSARTSVIKILLIPTPGTGGGSYKPNRLGRINTSRISWVGM